MKYLITWLILLTSFLSFGQSRLNSSEASIKAEFGDLVQLNYSETDDMYFLAMDIKEAVILYYLDAYRNCYCTIIIPKSDQDLAYLIEKYNDLYVTISTSNWRMYSNNGVADIKLEYLKDGGYYIIWTNI